MIRTIIQIAKSAGEIIEQEKKNKHEVMLKEYNSVVTTVDLKVNNFIISELKKYFPDKEIISEELISIPTKDSFFIIDPLDGTQEFLNCIDEPEKYTEYAVQIAYVEDGCPIMGVVYQPAIDKLYYAVKNKGAFLQQGTSIKRIFTKQSNRVVVGRYNIDEDLIKILSSKFSKTLSEVSQVGSFGIKVCQVAEGKYNSFVHTNFDNNKIHASLWDSSAPDIILREAGGRSFEMKTLVPIDYSSNKINLTQGYIATSNKSKVIIVFDVDGVLGNFEILKEKRDVAHITAVANNNLFSFQEAKKLFITTREKLRAVDQFSTIDTMFHLGISKEEFYNIMNSVPIEGGISCNPNAKTILQYLSKNCTLVALTNTPYLANIETLDYLRLLEYFDKVYSIDKYNFIKPSVEIFERIKMDFGAEQGYSIGDNAHKDLLPAKEAGFKTILFGDKKKVSGVDYKIDDLAKLKEIINLKNDN